MDTIYKKKTINYKNSFKHDTSNTNTKYSSDGTDIFKFMKSKEYINIPPQTKPKDAIKIRSININNKFSINAKKLTLSQPKDIISPSIKNSLEGIEYMPNINLNKINKNNDFSEFNNSTQNKSERIFLSNPILIKEKKIVKIKNNIINMNKIEFVNKLWDNLFIPFSYRQIFNEILSQLDEKDRLNLIEKEFNELDELRTNIEKLVRNINLRMELIKELKDMNNKLRLVCKNDEKESNAILIKNISQNIEKLRNITIIICFSMKKIKNIIHDGNYIGKYDLNQIAKEFKFDENYLIKMKEEMKFLKEGNMKYFFNIIEDHTPFLLKSSEEINKANNEYDPFMHKVPISEDIFDQIQKCNFIIYQELIGYQTKDFNDNKFRPISPLKNFFDEKMKNFETIKLLQNNCKFDLDKLNKKLSVKKNIPKFPDIMRNNNPRYKSMLKSNSCMNIDVRKFP